MKLIRLNTFETNSSSCNAITVLKTSDYVKFKAGELFYVGDYDYSDDHNTYYNELASKDFLTIEEIKDRVIDYINSEKLAQLKQQESDNAWGNGYRAAEYILKVNPNIDFYKTALSKDEAIKLSKSDINYEPTVFESELKREHYGQTKSNLSKQDWLIKNFLEYLGNYVRDFIMDTVLECESGRTSYYQMFEMDVWLVKDPIEVGDQTVIRSYISC